LISLSYIEPKQQDEGSTMTNLKIMDRPTACKKTNADLAERRIQILTRREFGVGAIAAGVALPTQTAFSKAP
jgi:hypothetical protein